MIRNYLYTTLQTLYKNRIMLFVNFMGLLMSLSICMASIIYIKGHHSNDNFYGERNTADIKKYSNDNGILFSPINRYSSNPRLVTPNYCSKCLIIEPKLKKENISKNKSLFMILGAINNLGLHTNEEEFQNPHQSMVRLNSPPYPQLPIMNYAVFNLPDFADFNRNSQPNIEIRL
ncbi:MAG: hypothetical protein HN729_10970 [Candidatus Marinimicrobia bacterium]|jgi:hypothetical protein|nr:hypothetical protein [Candidatus Neomarinimicrobiota bacterium]MBT3634301.1 hypothetical protein [Candidatus Neomarinimicrobiota bacterium]MBT3682900.1 hypothetical protein [Candidatus Neomarinimicrobiota bacterium]MBT3760110.1 hypothetical protein [Candidatus Neomarinimicrobiota bacterium]MBT3896123.1 hypothetical protein [Candidatus Neomarinimicrobiota bacterium]